MDQSNQSAGLSNIRETLTIVFKHKWKIIITFLIVSAVAVLFAMQQVQTYEAKGMLLVKFGREFLNRPEESGKPGSSPSIPPQTIVAGEITILTSRDLAERVVRSIGAETLYPRLTAAKERKPSIDVAASAVESFRDNLVVKSLPGSNFVEVSFMHRSPRTAAEVVNRVMELFKEKHLEVFGGEGTDFLKSQVKTFQNKLRQSEVNLEVFTQRNSLYSPPEQKSQLLNRIANIDTNLKAAQVQMNELEQRIVFIKSAKWVTDTPAETIANPASFRQQLSLLEQRERELLQRYTENSEAVQNLREEIRIAKESLARNSQTTREERRQIELAKCEGELSVLRVKTGDLKRQLAQSEGEIKALESHGRELQDLKREVSEDEQNFQVYSRRLEEAHITDDMDRRKMVAISVIEDAKAPAVPMRTKFNKERLVPGGLVGGLAAGVALAFLLEFMSHGMTTPASAEKRLGLPVMIAIRKKSIGI
jgi:polysaccharide biosynthesis protein PslE